MSSTKCAHGCRRNRESFTHEVAGYAYEAAAGTPPRDAEAASTMEGGAATSTPPGDAGVAFAGEENVCATQRYRAART